MSKLILDEALRAKLDLQNGPTELCDADGKAVAYVLSADEYTRLLYDLDRLESATPEAGSAQRSYRRWYDSAAARTASPSATFAARGARPPFIGTVPVSAYALARARKSANAATVRPANGASPSAARRRSPAACLPPAASRGRARLARNWRSSATVTGHLGLQVGRQSGEDGT